MPIGRVWTFIAALSCLVPAPASATDGVIEINQARALAGGITPGDTAGFPVTLSQPGQYRLTGNLDVPLLVDGISVGANDVSVDLNGHTLRCAASPPFCGGLNGIVASAGLQNTVIGNGTVRGFQWGVLVRDYSLVENVRAIGNNLGIVVNVAAVVRDCVVTGNAATGIQLAGGGSLAENNVVDDNGAHGVCTLSQVYAVALRGNVISANVLGALCPNQITGIYFNAGGNLCNNTPCP